MIAFNKYAQKMPATKLEALQAWARTSEMPTEVATVALAYYRAASEVPRTSSIAEAEACGELPLVQPQQPNSSLWQRMATAAQRRARCDSLAVFLYGRVLRSLPIFRGLSEVALTQLCRIVRRRLVVAGELLTEEGAVGTALYLVLDGEVEVSARGVRLGMLRDSFAANPGEETTRKTARVFGEGPLVAAFEVSLTTLS
jgi:hypothetical protein